MNAASTHLPQIWSEVLSAGYFRRWSGNNLGESCIKSKLLFVPSDTLATVALIVNRAFRLIEHRPIDPDTEAWAVLYTVHFDGDTRTETDKFFDDHAVQVHPASASLRTRYTDLYQTYGLYHTRIGGHGEGWFKDEGEGCLALQGKLTPAGRLRLPKPPPRLRLYCFCLDRQLLRDIPAVLDGLEPDEPGFPLAVFGGGGVKTTKDPRRCPNVKAHFAVIHHVRRRLRSRLEAGTVRLGDDGFLLEGDLTFSAKP